MATGKTIQDRISPFVEIRTHKTIASWCKRALRTMHGLVPQMFVVYLIYAFAGSNGEPVPQWLLYLAVSPFMFCIVFSSIVLLIELILLLRTGVQR